MTTDDWFKKGQELGRNGSYTDAIKAYDMAIKMSPKNATIWIEEDDTRKLALSWEGKACYQSPGQLSR
jgi:hypothetical protein